MMYNTGIAVHTLEEDEFLVAAATWSSSLRPHFSTREITLPYAKKNLPALVIVQNYGLINTINAACQRTIERLLIRTRFRTSQPPTVQLLVRPTFFKYRFVFPHIKKKYHWLLTAADSALFDYWERGIR